MSVNVKNYVDGDNVVIGGALKLEGTAAVENVPASTATTIAGLKDDINAILAALKAAGIMAPDTEG